MMALASIALAVVVLFGVWPLSGGDLVMHLTVGQWIWQHGWVPITDPFSYITEGQPFIAHSWLAEVAFYLIERSAGTVGFMLLRFTLILVAITFAAHTAQALGASHFAMLSLQEPWPSAAWPPSLISADLYW
jgi:hypothetical protein